MSKVLKLLRETEEINGDCPCIRRMSMLTSNGNETFIEELERALEENKYNLNFTWPQKEPTFVYESGYAEKVGNRYGEFMNKADYTCRMCLSCFWYVTSNYNDIPLGDDIPCYN
jgi:hypothetical protein